MRKAGTPWREFTYVEDAADACVHLMKRYSGEGQVKGCLGPHVAGMDRARRRSLKGLEHYDAGFPATIAAVRQ